MNLTTHPHIYRAFFDEEIMKVIVEDMMQTGILWSCSPSEGVRWAIFSNGYEFNLRVNQIREQFALSDAQYKKFVEWLITEDIMVMEEDE